MMVWIVSAFDIGHPNFNFTDELEMPFLMGTDEAGYGPNLGPLTITGTLWENRGYEENLYVALDESVKQKAGRNDNRLLIADSKQVYKSGSLKGLETSVLALIQVVSGVRPNNVQELCGLVCPSFDWTEAAACPGYDFSSISLPRSADLQTIDRHAEQLGETLERSQIQLLLIDCVPMLPRQFNDQVDRMGNKAHVLSFQTMQIVQRLKQHADDDLEIVCDKHGGRSKYADMIHQVLTQETVCVGSETKRESDYSFRESERDVVIRFRAGGEDFLPTAVASMVSKYVRELFMAAWNQHWCSLLPTVKPTKGYPVDARRFKHEIAAAQQRLQIADREIWRNR